MSEQAPERPAAPPAGKKENVLTRKLGPLPTWAWIAIAGALILGYVMFFGKKNKASSSNLDSSTSGDGTGGPGAGSTTIINRIIQPRQRRPPHTRHHRRGDHDEDREEDREHARHHDRMRHEHSPGAGGGPGPGPETDVPVGVDRRDKRGHPPPGRLVQFRTAEEGQTPSLLDVANHYGTDPEAIVQEAEGRGYPSSVSWKRYVSRHDWASPLPPATDLSILAHPQ